MELSAKAVAKWVHISPRKMRLVADTVRGKYVSQAVNELHFSDRRAATPVEKAVRSALANLLVQEDAAKITPDHVLIKEIWVDEGPSLKRWRPRAMGRAYRVRRILSHLTVVVSAQKIEKASKKK